MKELKTNKMSDIQGGIDNRSCMVMGGAAFLSAFLNPIAALGIVAGAAAAGCFEYE